MDEFNQICKRVFNSANWVTKVLIGLFLSPLVFLPFSYGYLYRYTRQIVQTKDMELPEWTDWKGLLIDGYRFLVVALGFFILPVLVGGLISRLFSELLALINLNFYPVFWQVLFIFFVLSIPCTISALIHFQRREDFKDLLCFNVILSRVMSTWKSWGLVLLAFVGFIVITAPLCPLSLFLGFVLLIPYMIIIFPEEGNEAKPTVIEKRESEDTPQ